MRKTILSIIIISMLWIGGCKDDAPTKSCSGPPTVSGGGDQTLVDKTSATLNGTTSATTGTWTIMEGQGGKIQDGTPVVFTGEPKASYKLKFEAKNDCGTASDVISVSFNVSCGSNETLDQFVANVHWIQQSCFRIEAAPFTIYIDPNSITVKDTADVVLITHSHDDHYTASDLDKICGPKTILIAPQDVVYSGVIGKRVILKPGDGYIAFGCVNITAVPAYNIVKTSFHPKANNWVGYVITVNGITLYHAGDTERIPEMSNITCDIAMLPLGQTYTFDKVSDAVDAAKDVKAKLAIPMHYGVHEGTEDDAVTFKSLLDGVIPVVIKERGK